MAMYGAPVWVDALSRDNKTLLRRPQRVIATRAIRGGDPRRNISLRGGEEIPGEPPTLEEVARLRRQAQDTLLRRWSEDLNPPVPGQWTVDAVRPVLRKWVRRRFGPLTFRLVQVLSGHGCFGKYLHKIARREATPACHACGAPEDTALHTLEVCAAWEPQRRALSAVLGQDLSLPSVVSAMLDSERSWQAAVSFCEEVMTQKEAAERAREDDVSADPLRRRRTGVRRRRFAHLFPPRNNGVAGRSPPTIGQLNSATPHV
ncbi:unnamed protein product [Euphydryas editha]|uniref:Reverse transcriptase n=1 Tax=Euphydryas editha TaxID=104508 RepID=A0AAU9UDZ6_EUPED|nr:unnamed protein product [Euphydryas editha]